MSSAENYAVWTSELTKQFGGQTAVNGINLAVPSGSVFGFLGPNGSGKTTTIRMLLGLAEATSGEIELLGEKMPKNAEKALPRVGALVEGPAFYPYLSGKVNLRRLDSASKTADPKTREERIEKALAKVGLTNASNKKVHKYSLGMKQRLGIANALLQNRDLLVLDEPTNGLDPQGTREVRNLIRSLSSDGTTILVSSHLLSEIEQLCSHVAVMSAGRIVAQGSLPELQAQNQTYLKVITPDSEKSLKVLSEFGLKPRQETKDGLEIFTSEVEHGFDGDQVLRKLLRAKVKIKAFAVEQASLEDRFVDLTGEGFDVVQ